MTEATAPEARETNHRARGLELLDTAEAALAHQRYDRAAVYAAVAAAHFAAAEGQGAEDD